MRARGTVRALRAVPIVTGCGAVCCVPTVAIALTGAPSQKPVVAVGAAVGPTKKSEDRGKRAAEQRRHRAAHRRKLVASRFTVQSLAMTAQAGHFVTLQGRLLPAAPGKVVSLVGRAGGRWSTLARGRTGGSGRFALHYAVARVGRTRLRVRYAGGRDARAAAQSVGSVVGLEPTVASWYYDAGSTACGFHAYYGVASKTLPCGTRVTFEYGGHAVVATVDDRGPYIYGRDFDFNQNLSAKLGMYGVATVLASVR